jgi:hypothetical protein
MLNRRDRLILEALLPSGAHASLPYGVAEVNFDAFWSAFERTALPSWHRGFRAALWIATWFAPLLVRRLPPLTLHDRPTRERALAAMEHSRLYLLRQMLGLLKTTVCLGYGADDDVRQAIGYPGRPDERHR